MSIKFDQTKYKIRVEEESCVKTDHSTINQQSLPSEISFIGEELFKIIILTGMLPSEVAILRNNPKYRSEEFHWRSEMIRWVLSADSNNYLTLDKKNLGYLESSEKRNIDFWLGMYFAALIAKTFCKDAYINHTPNGTNPNPNGNNPTPKYEYVIHYSSFVKSSLGKVKNLTNYKPDFIAADSSISDFGVFEAKGRMEKKIDEKTMEHAYEQAASVKSIEKNTQIDRIVSYSLLECDKICVRVKDPPVDDTENEGKKKERKLKEIDIDLDFKNALIWQYMPLVEYINENGAKDENNYVSCKCQGLFEIESIRMNKDFYTAINNVYMAIKGGTVIKLDAEQIIEESIKTIGDLVEKRKGIGFETNFDQANNMNS